MQFSSVSHLFSIIEASNIEKLNITAITSSDIQLDIKRDDRLHDVLSGNKWRKLKYLLLSIEKKGVKKVATMGGAYSNFAHSLAYVCHCLGWECELYIRAYPEQPLTKTLQDCERWGANINFTNRENFRKFRVEGPKLQDDIFWIKEGGLQVESILGLKEIFMEFEQQYDYIVIASATGTSVAGLVEGSKGYQKNINIIGVSVLNNAIQQQKDVRSLVKNENKNWNIIEGYEFGGFAKSNDALNGFIFEFEQETKIQLEPLYSGKSFYAVFDLIKKNYFPKKSRILLIHCGGLQGLVK